MVQWAEKMHEQPAEKLEEQMPLAVMIDCASRNSKRARELGDTAKDKDEALQLALQAKEEADAKYSKVSKERDEMQALAEERQTHNEELTLRIEQMHGTARRYNFQNPTSRERAPAPAPAPAPARIESGMSASERAEFAAPIGGITSTLDVASRGAARVCNPLLDMLKMSGAGSGRVMRSNSANGLLGGIQEGGASSSSFASNDPDVAAAIRGAMSGGF